MQRTVHSFFIIACLALSALAGQLQAQTFVRLSKQASAVEDRCYDKASYFGQEQLRCGFAAEARQAQLVKSAYAAARSRAPASKRSALSASQRRWTAVMERACRKAEVLGPTEIGMIAMVEGLRCLSGEYVERIDWLERQYRTQKPQR